MSLIRPLAQPLTRPLANPLTGGSGGVPVWTPWELNPDFFWDQSQGAYDNSGNPVTLGGQVHSIGNNSPNTQLLQQTNAAKRPTLGAGGRLIFDGVDDGLVSNSSRTIGTSNLTFFIVCKGGSGTGFRQVMGIGAGTLFNGFANLTTYQTSRGIAPHYPILVTKTALNSFIVSNTHNGTTSIRLNGGADTNIGTTGGNNLTSDFVYLAHRLEGGLFFDGEIYACGYFTRLLSTEENNLLEAWLEEKRATY